MDTGGIAETYGIGYVSPLTGEVLDPDQESGDASDPEPFVPNFMR